MAKKPDKPVYSFIRRGRTLVPEMDYDAHVLDGVAERCGCVDVVKTESEAAAAVAAHECAA